jgi:hypothetical protein
VLVGVAVQERKVKMVGKKGKRKWRWRERRLIQAQSPSQVVPLVYCFGSSAAAAATLSISRCCFGAAAAASAAAAAAAAVIDVTLFFCCFFVCLFRFLICSVFIVWYFFVCTFLV